MVEGPLSTPPVDSCGHVSTQFEHGSNPIAPLNIAGVLGKTFFTDAMNNLSKGRKVFLPKIKGVYKYTAAELDTIPKDLEGIHNNRTLLGWAAEAGVIKTVEELTALGCEVSKPDDLGYTPLHLAAAQGHLDVVKLLVEKGADLNVCNINGISPLLSSCQCKDVEMAKYLLEKGAERVTPSGRDIEEWAEKFKRKELVEYLQEEISGE